MRTFDVRVHASREDFDRTDHLAWRLAEVAADRVEPDSDVVEMVINRLIDNAAVAAASLSRPSPTSARAQARGRLATPGATVWGVDGTRRTSPEWAAWANAVAVRELDFHDTFLAEEYAHPGDNVAPLLAVAQHAEAARDLRGSDLVRAIATAYEVQIDLCRGISLHRHKIDHVAHLGASVAAGLGDLLGLDVDTVFQSINQSVHTTTATRQSRKGEISTWKAFAPAFAAKVSIEAVDRAMRGETSPAPIYEGEDAIIAWLLDGPEAHYHVALPEPGESKRALLESFTKEHSAEYQAQAWIDLALRLHREHPEIGDGRSIESVLIRSSHHTHVVIGTGSNDPQKFDPDATRETLDHSLPYIFTVALQDGEWHHERSYASGRAHRPDTIALWQRVRTEEDAEWSSRYLSTDPSRRAFGGAVEILFRDGTTLRDEIVVPDAHPLGRRPFAREDYVRKFLTLSDGIVDGDEADRFLEVVTSLHRLEPGRLGEVNFRARPGVLDESGEPRGLW